VTWGKTASRDLEKAGASAAPHEGSGMRLCAPQNISQRCGAWNASIGAPNWLDHPPTGTLPTRLRLIAISPRDDDSEQVCTDRVCIFHLLNHPYMLDISLRNNHDPIQAFSTL